MKHAIPEAVLQQHTAFLGKTGSGKTSTAKLAVEQIIRDNPAARVCVLDPIKSDWWGLISTADGKRPGLPFHILGGPRGHVPLHDSAGKAIGELVANGSLPLSIIDMADFNAGGLQKFFNDFAPALLKRMRGVVYLVIEEAHEFAPKERSGIGAENMAIHWAKKLATAGRSKGIRMMVLTQRTQALHNALLGSCDTIIAHRLTAPADQEPVKKWLKANVNKEIFEKVSSSMSSLKTGSAWICSGEAQVAELVQFPKISTYDNSATPTGDMADLEVRTAPVDAERLRAIIGNAVKEAEADDPKRLRAEIARLTALTKASTNIPQNIPADPEVIENAERRGYVRGFTEARQQGDISFETLKRLTGDTVKNFVEALQSSLRNTKFDVDQIPPSGSPAVKQAAVEAPKRMTAVASPAMRKPSPAASGDGALTTPQRRVMTSLAFWKSIGHESPTREQVAAVAGYRPGSGNFNNIIGGLSTMGQTTVPAPGRLALNVNYEGLSPDEASDKLWSVLDNPQRRLVEAAKKARGDLSREELAIDAGYAPGSGNFNNITGRLTSMDILRRAGTGRIALSDWAREVLS